VHSVHLGAGAFQARLVATVTECCWTGARPGCGSGIQAGVGVVADTRLRGMEGEVWRWLDGSAERWGPEPVGRLVERVLVVMCGD
jgi:hypothetical protein